MGVYIIAEAGVNHNGSLTLAKRLVDEAVAAGADAVKFQTFKTEALVTREAEQAQYQMENLGEKISQFEMLKRLELSFEDFQELQVYCDKKKITFLSTAFDLESVDFLVKTLKLPLMKIPSGELSNSPFLYYIAKNKVQLILSTGMANMEEIHQALAVIAYGLAGKTFMRKDAMTMFYHSEEAKQLLKDYVRVLHCTTEYPTPPQDINLKSIEYLEEELKLPIGLSDHSEGISIPLGAVAVGAKIIEKHFTLDQNLPGPDHRASLEPHELKEMVKGIRDIEKALGSKMKNPVLSELKNRDVARKSLVAANNITKGTPFTTANLTVKRPGTGISPTLYWDYIGKISDEDYQRDELIR